MEQQPPHGFGNDDQPRDQRFAHIDALLGQMSEFRERVHNLQASVDASYNYAKRTIDATNTAIKHFGKFKDFLVNIGRNTNSTTLSNCRSEVLTEMQKGGRMYTQREEWDYNRHCEIINKYEEHIADLESNMRILEDEAVENDLPQELAVKNQKITDLKDLIKAYQYQLEIAMVYVDKCVAEKKCYCQSAWPQAVQENQQLRESLAESMKAAKEAEKNYKSTIENLQGEIFRYKMRVRNVERNMACMQVETQEVMKTVSTTDLFMNAPEESFGSEIVDTPITIEDMLDALQLNAEETND